jgi:hypothetical protein
MAGSAQADLERVFPGRREAELIVKRGHPEDLCRWYVQVAAHQIKGCFGQVLVLALDHLQNGDEAAPLPAEPGYTAFNLRNYFCFIEIVVLVHI